MTEAELLKLDDLQFVERAYPLILGRPADPSGLRDYLKRVREGVSKKQIVAELRNSEEGRRYAERLSTTPAKSRPAPRLGNQSLADLMQLSDEAFVDQAYRLTLGRTADPSGRAHYLLALQNGVERIEVLRQLLDSREGVKFNAPLPELRQAIERRSLRRLPGIRHALRALRRLSAHARKTDEPIPLSIAPPHSTAPSSVPTEGIDPYRANRTTGAAAGRVSIQSFSSAPLVNQVEAMSRLAHASAMAEQLVDKPINGLAAGHARQPWELEFDRFVGPVLYGASRVGGNAAPFAVEFGGCSLGLVVPVRTRSNEDKASVSGEYRFAAILGGVLQFSAMAPRCSSVKLAQIDPAGGARGLDLHDYLAEALTFAPMRALLRPLFGRKSGQIRSMRLISPMEASIVFEADETPNPEAVVLVDLYQEQTAGKLLRIGRFEVELAGGVVDLEFHLIDPDAPLLMVITDHKQGIIVTDCFPLPSLCSEKNSPLVEYHVVLESGKSPFNVVAKIARTFLDRAIRLRAASAAVGDSGRNVSAVSSEGTCLVISARDGADPSIENLLKAHRGLAKEVVFLDSLGRVTRMGGEMLEFRRFVADSDARHFLFIDAHVHLRPDFWSILDDNAHRGTAEASITYWHSIWIDGLSRPQVVKVAPMLHPAFAQHQLLETRALLADRAAVEAAADLNGAIFASGRLVLEKAFCMVDLADVAAIPVVMHTVRTPIAPLVVQRFQAEQTVLDMHPPRVENRSSGPGVSVVINYRDGVEDTLRCLASIAAQRCEGPVELVLVNNGSTAVSVTRITRYARDLFGDDNVRKIDYPHRFNHSTQCNIAAESARHDFLLMLSNDSVLRTPTAIARSARVAAVPWVGTCGFRIIGDEGNKSRLQSLGLTLNPRRYLFSGGSPVSTSLAPSFALDCTFEVIGNTFAAVMLRRDVYRALDGLDSVAFPTNYNDIDFSFRATNAGFRHVVVGSEIVEHMGRGSREADQDLPIDQRIIERAPRLELLARIGFQQL